MAKTLNRLSAKTVASIKETGRYADGGNLYLSISPNGGRRWVFLFRWHGRPKEIGLGSARTVSLAQARELAKAAREKLAAGIMPTSPRRASGGSTFGEMADRYIEAMKSDWGSEKHLEQWETTLREQAAPLRQLPVNAVTTDDVLAVLKPLWSEVPVTASRLRGRIERILDAAKAQGLRTGENPARWKGHLDKLLPKRQRRSRRHHPAMPYPDVPAFLAELGTRTGKVPLALRFVILTAVRAGDILGQKREDRPPMMWSHVNLDDRLWTIPATKNDSEHRVPLSDAAVAVLKRAAGLDSDIVFPIADSMRQLLRAMRRPDITVHGFRSSFRDWVAEKTNFPRELAEKAIEHTIGDETERAYQRGDLLEKRRELMEAWAKYCLGVSDNMA